MCCLTRRRTVSQQHVKPVSAGRFVTVARSCVHAERGQRHSRRSWRSRQGRSETQIAWCAQITPYFHRCINKGQQSLISSSAVDLCTSPVNIVWLRMVFLFLFQMNWPFSKGQPVTILTCITVSRTLLDTESQTGSNTGMTLGLFHFMPYPKRYSLFTGQFWTEFYMHWSTGHWLGFQDPFFLMHI